MFPDRTPSPGLVEYKKVSEPVRIGVDPRARTISVRNLHHTRDTGYLRWRWVLEEEGAALGRGELAVPAVRAGDGGSAGWPEELSGTDWPGEGRREVWLTVSAVLGEAEGWAPTGHEVAWAQERVNGRARRAGDGATAPAGTAAGTAAGTGADAAGAAAGTGAGAAAGTGAGAAAGTGAGVTGVAGVAGGDVITLGAARFDGRTGVADQRWAGSSWMGRGSIYGGRRSTTTGRWWRGGGGRGWTGCTIRCLGSRSARRVWTFRARVGAAGTGPGVDVTLPVADRRRSGSG